VLTFSIDCLYDPAIKKNAPDGTNLKGIETSGTPKNRRPNHIIG